MSRKFEWTWHYSVNVKEIDEQHKEFLKIANDLIDLADKDNFNKEEALIKAGELGSYAFYHLSTEEEFFNNVNYPDKDEHINYHNIFRNKVNDLMNEIRKEDSDKILTTREMSYFAGDWLLNHILIADKKYTKFFNEHGLK